MDTAQTALPDLAALEARIRTRARQLIKLGFTERKAWCCARNGRGPWWNAGSSHMNAAYPNAAFERIGLISIRGNRSSFCLNIITITNRRDTEPYVRWCGRTAGVTPPPTRYRGACRPAVEPRKL